jgi:prepilin-type N-terminal cleavage/methylation domain-containing protein
VSTGTSRTGTSSSSPGASPGYTLVEMIIVVILLALCAGLLFPRISGGLFADDYKVGLRRMLAMTTQARQEAILKGAPHLLVMDIGETSCMRVLSAAAVAQNGTLAAGPRLCLPAGLQVTGVRKGGEPVQESGTLGVAFLPNGLCEPTLFYLKTKNGAVRTISLKGLGQVEAFEGEILPREPGGAA